LEKGIKKQSWREKTCPYCGVAISTAWGGGNAKRSTRAKSVGMGGEKFYAERQGTILEGKGPREKKKKHRGWLGVNREGKET